MAGPGLGIGQCGGALGVDRRECVDHRHTEGKGGPQWLKSMGLPALWVTDAGKVGEFKRPPL